MPAQASPSVVGVDEVTIAINKRLLIERQGGGRLSSAKARIVRPGDILVGESGFNRAVQLCDALEEELRALLTGRDGLKLFAVFRHISPRMWANSPRGDAVHQATRRVAEVAVHRYACWPEKVALPYHLPRISPQFLPRVAAVLVAAEDFANTLSIRRRIAKGQRVRIGKISPLDLVVDNQGSLGRLVDIRDSRVEQDSNLMGALGGVLTPSAGPTVGSHQQHIVAVKWIDPMEYLSAAAGTRASFEQMGDGSWISLFERTCRQGFISDVDALRRELSDRSEAIRAVFGFGATDLHAVLECITKKITQNWAVPPRTLDHHGFVVLPPPSDDELLSVITSDRYRNDPSGPPTLHSVTKALKYLDAGVADVRLTQPKQQRPLRRMGNALLYDAANVEVGPLLWATPLPEYVRRQLAHGFEGKVHEELGKLGVQPWSSGHIVKVDRNAFTDVDASVVVNSIFVVVDCYASSWSSALDEGSHSETRNRAEHLVDKLRKWDRQWAALVDGHPDLLPSAASALLPVVISAVPEWIHLNDSDLWFEATVPRICTIGELLKFLKSGVPRDAPGLIPLGHSR